MSRKTKLILTAAILAAAGIAVFLILKNQRNGQTGRTGTEVVDWETGIEDSGTTGESIEVPGYNTIYMKAGQKTLQMSIGNPKENSCYFRVHILLEDGTELFVSEILPPGKGMTEEECAEALAAGTYSASARFECFADAEGTQALNGADSAFTLIVQ